MQQVRQWLGRQADGGAAQEPSPLRLLRRIVGESIGQRDRRFGRHQPGGKLARPDPATGTEAAKVQVARLSGAIVAGLSVNHLTGHVIFPSAPAAQPYADFRFDVPCHFDIDHLPVVATAFHLQQVSSIAIVEIRA